jgi:hypothetical protein
MGGKDQFWSVAGDAGVDVPAGAGSGALNWLRDGGFLHFPTKGAKELGQKIAGFALVIGGGFNLAQLAGKPNRVNCCRWNRAAHDGERIQEAG